VVDAGHVLGRTEYRTMAVYKNIASQKIAVYAHDTAADAPKTGDAAQITAQISLDGGATDATDDANPTELEATDAPGIYLFDMTQAETNADLVILCGASSTGDVSIEPVIIYTLPGTNAGVSTDVTAISGDSTAANNAELFFDGTGYAGTNNVIPTVTNVTNQVTADMTAISGDTTAANNAESYFDGTGYAGTNNVIPTVTTVGTVTTNSDLVTAEVIADAVWDELVTGHDGAGKAGLQLWTDIDAILVDTGDLQANQAAWATATVVDLNADQSGVTVGTVTDVTNQVTADVTAISGDTTAADNLELDYDGTGLTRANSTIGTVTTNTDLVTAATIADAVWDEAAAGHTDAGKAGLQLWTDIDAILVDTADLQTNQGAWATATTVDLNADQSAVTVGTVTDVTNQVTADMTAISGDAAAANNAESFFDGTGYAGTGNTIPTVTTVGTVTTLTGHTAQTGDSFARIGAPAGVSVSADIAALPDSAAVNTAVDTAFTTIMADSIPADGVIPTREQALYMINQFLLERETAGVTVTVNKVDGSTTLFTLTLDDDTSPTSITRAT